MKKYLAKVVAMVLVAGTMVCSASAFSGNAGEEELLKKMNVTSMKKLSSQDVGSYDENDVVVHYSNMTEVEMPYYVGKEKKSFLKGKEYDEVLYLRMPYYLPDLNEKAVYFSVSDEEIATIDGNKLVAKKQGTVTVTAYNSKKKSLGNTVFAVTTYNDGKDVINARSLTDEDLWRWGNTRDVEYWKTNVNTIQDMCYYLQAMNFVYNFEKEPDFLGVNRWQWTADPEVIFAMSGGVCIQVAQMGNYMLADNFEDWGNIIVSGNYGHIFNWYYEDGYYYVMDFTEVISDNAWNSDGSYRDYTNSIKKFKSISKIKKWITSEKVDTKENFLVCMYSNLGHDYMPCWLDTGCQDTRAVNEKRNIEPAQYGFQDIVFEEMTVLYQRKGVNLELKGYSVEEIPTLVKGGIYGYETVDEYYYDYK